MLLAIQVVAVIVKVALEVYLILTLIQVAHQTQLKISFLGHNFV